ncbi:cupin domain-containing protein [Halodesulfovibrio sp.]|jgi:quercetin dioxygenase-like cupin family protein|uniref:cupin domain-containing protein n=1 Tax=Halodesulfovibrio sp. TaxID=1912772 RepID=UPI0025D32E51|nr:cupin domain-containing protein [Halodesulfovibrio sp.]MCT4536245.1 ectoine synthase [Halodesulfovibrio sp.]
MRKNSITESRSFNPSRMHVQLVHESEHVKVMNFNLKAGQEMPVHSHHLEGELVMVVLNGNGELLGEHGPLDAIKTGDVLICEIKEPHGVRASTDMSLVVTIAPPI